MPDEPPFKDSAQIEALRAAIAQGVDSGPGTPAEEVFNRLEAKYRAMADQAVRRKRE